MSRYRVHAARFDAIAATRPAADAAVEISLPQLAGATRNDTPSERELEVLQLVSQGFVSSQIGTRLCVTEETVKSHVGNMLRKLSAQSRAHAVGIGLRRGLIT